MKPETKPDNPTPADQIDLGQFFNLLKGGLETMANGFLRLYVYLRKKLFIILGLLIGGLIIGMLINQVIHEKYKIEVIVKPNLESKDYLYDVVQEIQTNLNGNNIEFFNALGFDISTTEGYSVEINKLAPIEQGMEQEMAYLELLLSTENAALISDVLRAELLNRSSLTHRVTIYFKNTKEGPGFAKSIMDYINSNNYFQQLSNINQSNAQQRIEENRTLIDQIDKILNNYSEKLEKSGGTPQDRIVLQAEDGLDVPGLLNWKSKLIKEIEGKKLEMLAEQEAVTILNFGRTQRVQKIFFSNAKYMVPLVLLLCFFLWEWLRYLDHRAQEKQLF